jgi:hypothetical protein
MRLIYFLQSQLGRIFTFLVILSVILIALNMSIHKKTDYLVKFKSKDIVSILIDSQEGQIIIHKGKPNAEYEWVVEHEGKTKRMDNRALLAYFSTITHIESVEKFPLSDFQPTQIDQLFGSDSGGKIALKLSTGKKIILTIGRATPSGTELYAALTEDPEIVYTIPNRYELLLFPSFLELQSRQLIDTAGAASIVLLFNGNKIELFNNNNAWISSNDRLSDKLLQELPKAIKGIFFENYFPQVAETELASYGLTVPDVIIWNKAKSGQQEEIHLSRYGASYYSAVASGEKRDVFILNNQSASALISLLQKITK